MANYIVDILIIVLILLFTFWFAGKGLVQSLLKSCSWLVSIIATYLLYPVISGIIRGTVIFDFLKDAVYGVINFGGNGNTSGMGQIDTINSLSLPDVLKGLLIDNNNSVIYDLLGADSLQSYISGYIANIVLNIVVSLVVFIVILIIIRTVTSALKIAVSLPVVKQINSIGGGILGFFWGVVFIWVLMALSTLFITTPAFADITMAIDNSILGKLLYDNNIIMNVLLAKLFGWG